MIADFRHYDLYFNFCLSEERLREVMGWHRQQEEKKRMDAEAVL